MNEEWIMLYDFKRMVTEGTAMLTRDFFKRHIASAGIIFLTVLTYILLRRGNDWLPMVLLLLSGGGIALWGGVKSRVVFVIMLGIFCCIERHFILHYGDGFHEIGTQALLTMYITDPDEILSYFSVLKIVEFIIPLIFLAELAVVFYWKSESCFGKWRKTAVSLSLISFFLMLFYICYRPVCDYLREWRGMKDFLVRRQQFHFQARDLKPEEKSVYFLVIGESHRKDEFDNIVLEKGAAPLLAQARREGKLFEFDDMISYYQQTWFSVFTLLSRRGSDDQSIFFPEKGLFSLFQEAGYKVYYVTYQRKGLSATGYDNVVNEADVYINHRDSSSHRLDTGMLPEIDRILRSDEKKVLIVIKMVGCHFNYYDRFPDEDEFRIYRPCYDERNFHGYRIEEKEMLVNTYRNALHFSGGFLNGIAERCAALSCPSMMLFLSDHGVINYDDGKNPFFGAAQSNFHIPCILFMNEAYRAGLSPDVADNLRKHRSLPAGNDYVFDTFVTLAGIDYPSKRSAYDLTSSDVCPAENRRVWIWKHQIPYDSLPEGNSLPSPEENLKK